MQDGKTGGMPAKGWPGAPSSHTLSFARAGTAENGFSSTAHSEFDRVP